MAKKFKKKAIAIIGVVAGALLGYGAINLFGNQIVYGVPQELYGVPQRIEYQEIISHNSKFESYEGRIKGSSVKSLLQIIISHNNEYLQEYNKIVSFNGIKIEEELVNIKTTIKTANKYNISLEYSEGYVKNIICEEVK